MKIWVRLPLKLLLVFCSLQGTFSGIPLSRANMESLLGFGVKGDGVRAVQDLPNLKRPPIRPESDRISASQSSAMGNGQGLSERSPSLREEDPSHGIGRALRPGIGMRWFQLENTRFSRERARMAFLGPQVQLSLAWIRTPVFELGVRGAYFQSLTSMGERSQDARVSDLVTETYASYQYRSGWPKLRLGLGWHQNKRDVEASFLQTGSILGTVRGARGSMEVSMKLDTAIRAGLQAAQTRAFGGLQEFGGFVSHSPKETQEFRLGFHAAALSQSDGADVSRLQETWTQLSLGYVIGF